MPPKKTAPSKRTPAKRKKKAASSRVVSDSHKAAMAAGREAARAVNAYLSALESLRPKRGRRVTKEDLERRLTAAREQTEQASGAARLLAIQAVEDIEAAIRALSTSANQNLSDLEKAFAKSAKAYGESKGISYSTWRKAGVPADLLKKAGIARTRSA
jgi:hypothetical protein